MDWYAKVEKFVSAAFLKSSNAGDMKHFERTVFWLKELKPDADEAMLIAAFAHDIERAFRNERTYNKITGSDKGFTSQAHLQYHQETGAKIISDFLTAQHAPPDLVSKVSNLISKHEVGGTEEENILKDADSISYFETQIDMFLKDKVKSAGEEKVRVKFEWMFNRITSPKAKTLAEPMYKSAIKRLIK